MEMKRFLRKRRVAHKVTRISPEKVVKPKSFEQTKEKAFIKSIVSEICGLSPYEKKALDLYRKGEEKKAKTFLKKRLGSMARAEKKFDKITSK